MRGRIVQDGEAGASLKRTLLLMITGRTLWPKAWRTSSSTSWACRVLPLYMVTRMPATSKGGFSLA